MRDGVDHEERSDDGDEARRVVMMMVVADVMMMTVRAAATDENGETSGDENRASGRRGHSPGRACEMCSSVTDAGFSRFGRGS
jgi:hypothetical protein